MATLPNAPDPNEANLNDAVKLELLRKRNLELHAEIEQLKFKSEFRSYSRKITVVDTRRLELVWMFLPAIPWNIFWYTNDRGAEYTQLYFWIVKDWAWIVRSYRWGIIIGALSCAWSVCVCAKSIVNGNWREMCHSFCIFLWLLGTYLWETGDLHDHQFPHGQPVAHIRRMECSYLLIIALILHGIYFFFLRPKLPNKSSPFITALSKPFVDNMKGMTGYDEPRLKFQTWHFKCTPVFSMTVWRDYEAAQIFFWIGKDLAAALGIEIMWIVFYIPSFILSLYLINTSLNTRRVLIDHCHYLATHIWLLGVFIWQMGFLFFKAEKQYNHWGYLYPRNYNAEETCYFWGAWVTLVGSLIPLAVLYMIWLPATALGWIKDDVEELAFKEEYSETMMEESGMGRGGGGGGDSYFFSSVSNSLAASEASAKANSAVAVDVAAVALMEEARAEAPAEGASSKKRSRIKRPAVPPVEEAPVSPTELEISWIDVNRSELFEPL